MKVPVCSVLFLLLALGCSAAILSAQTVVMTGHAAPFKGTPTLCECPEGTPMTLTLELHKSRLVSIQAIGSSRELDYPLVVAPVFSGIDPLAFRANKLTLTVGKQSWVSEFGSTEGGYVSFANMGSAPGSFNYMGTMKVIVSEYTQERMAYLDIDVRSRPETPLWNAYGNAAAPQLIDTPRVTLAAPYGDRVVFLVDSIIAKPVALDTVAPPTQARKPGPGPSGAFLPGPGKFADLEAQEPSAFSQAVRAVGPAVVRLGLVAGELLTILSLTSDTPQPPDTAQKLEDSLKKPCRFDERYTVTFPASKVPAITAHIALAQAGNDQWRVLTKSSSNEKAKTLRRNAACKDTRVYIRNKGQNGILSCDEYPFASSAEGVEGASGWAVPVGEQYIQGYIIMRFYTGLDDGVRKPDGTRFCVDTVQ